MSRPTLSPERVARALGVNAETVRRWCKAGHIQHARPAPGGKFLIPASEVDRIWDEIKGKE